MSESPPGRPIRRDLAAPAVHFREREVSTAALAAHSNCVGQCGLSHGALQLSRGSSVDWKCPQARRAASSDPYTNGALLINRMDRAMEQHVLQARSLDAALAADARHWLNLVLLRRRAAAAGLARGHLRTAAEQASDAISPATTTTQTARRMSLVERSTLAGSVPFLHERTLPVPPLLEVEAPSLALRECERKQSVIEEAVAGGGGSLLLLHQQVGHLRNMNAGELSGSLLLPDRTPVRQQPPPSRRSVSSQRFRHTGRGAARGGAVAVECPI